MTQFQNIAKPVYAWTVDGTKVGDFGSGLDAADILCASRASVSRAAREGRILGGKYILAYHDEFPGVPDFIHKNSKPVWAWTLELELAGKYESQSSAAKELGLQTQNIRDSITDGSIADGKYLFTKAPTPPSLSERQKNRLNKPVVQKVKGDKYILEELKWGSFGEFTDMEAASAVSGLHARTIRRMILNGKVYHKMFRSKMKGKKICIEKREWTEIGRGRTITELANVIGTTPQVAWRAHKLGGVAAGKYKIIDIPKPIAVASVNSTQHQ